MSSDFLKQAIEAESQGDARRKAVLVASGLVLLIAVSGAAISLWSQSHSEAPERPITSSGDGSAIPLMQTTTQAPEGSNSVGTANPTQSTAKPSQKPVNQTYVPLPKPSGVVDHNAFVADARVLVARYSEIVGLVSFSPTDSDEVKASKIRQAAALDRQSFGTLGVRKHLVMAGVESGRYMELTELAESAMVDVKNLERWTNDKSDALSYDYGLSDIRKGAEQFKELSRQI
jgi:hypothetical protein